MSDRSPHGRMMQGPERPKSKDLRHLRRTYGFLKPYWPQLLVAGIALVIVAGATLSIGIGLQRLIDEGFVADDPDALNGALAALFVVITMISIGTFLRFFAISWVGERVVADIRAAVFNRVITLSPGFFEVTRTGEVLSRLTTDTTLIQTVVGSSLSIALRNMLTFTGGIVMLLITNAKLTGLVALVVPLVVIPIIVFGRMVRKLSRASQDRVADVGASAEESLNAIRTVQAFVHEDRDKAQFKDEVDSAFRIAVRRVVARGALGGIVVFLIFSAIGVILWIGGRSVIEGTLSAGELSAFVFYALIVAGATGALADVIGDLQRAAGATERLVELLETQSDIEVPETPVPMPEPATGSVAFEEVVFHYPSRPDTAALERFNLTVAPGETVALVGPSGAGKTTVFQLLLRFYDPKSGAVKIDGVDIKQAHPQDARARIGLVSQEPVVFASNARENIRYGRPEATDGEVLAAAKAANALEFIEELPEGFDTFLGEKGVRLSGGQRQRIAIARAILNDPAVLLLDEATSALDAESERLVQDALDHLMEGRTTMVIAHRLATVVNADRIIVMDRGQVVSAGSHEELLRTSDLYARLAKLQFSADAAA